MARIGSYAWEGREALRRADREAALAEVREALAVREAGALVEPVDEDVVRDYVNRAALLALFARHLEN